MPCCHWTRRQVLSWGALVGVTPLLGGVLDPERVYAAGRRSSTIGPALPINLELVTRTESSLVVTWYTGDPTSSDEFGRPAPAPADTELLLGTSPANLRQVHYDASTTPYHYVEVTGLDPGQTYFYLARSGGVPALPATFGTGNPVGTSALPLPTRGPYEVTTAQPPPGTFLFSVVLCNDLHLGETTAGLVSTQLGVQIPPGFSQVPGEPPYPEVMAKAMVADATARGANLLLVAGDVSSEAVPGDLATARGILDGFGNYRTNYLVARGNHDRSHSGTPYASCRVDPRGADLHDCFRDAFTPAGEPTWFRHQAYGLKILGLDTYDKTGNGGDNGVLSAEQFAFVRATLADEPDRPTLVFGHHPVSLEASVTTAEPLVFDLNVPQAQELTTLYGSTPGVFLHHQAHTHRNKKTLSPNAPNVVFQEVSSTKEYPGGFHLLRVFTGGYALNYYKTRSDLSREWSERTRQEDFGGVPFYVFGNVNDRNSVVARDFSGLRPAAGAGSDLPDLGLPGLAVGAAALAGGAVLAGRRWAGR